MVLTCFLVDMRSAVDIDIFAGHITGFTGDRESDTEGAFFWQAKAFHGNRLPGCFFNFIRQAFSDFSGHRAGRNGINVNAFFSTFACQGFSEVKNVQSHL